VKEVPLHGKNGIGRVTLVDRDDYETVMQRNWFVANGYVISRGERLHRFIMKPAPGEVVDHANGETLDNRRSNLRVCLQARNTTNHRPYKNLKYIGVCRAGRGRYRATFKNQTLYKNLGVFDTAEQAALAWNKQAVIVYGEFARLNEVAES
jgi:hypothetical protein